MLFSLFSIAFAEPQVSNPLEGIDMGYSIKVLPIIRFNADFDSATEDTTWKTMQTMRLITQKSWEGMVIRASFQDARIWGLESSPVVASVECIWTDV